MWVFFWIFLSILVGAFASSKKRSGVGWFFLAMVISPLIAFIILLVLGPPSSILKKCPNCAEEVKSEALVCRFCGYKFTERNEETSLSSQEEIEDSSKKRISCSDGSCIGVINEKGICNICGKKYREEVKSREEAIPFIPVEEKEGEGLGEEKRLSKEGKAEKRRERESQTKGKSIPKFSNREEYEKWRAGRLKGMDKKDK